MTVGGQIDANGARRAATRRTKHDRQPRSPRRPFSRVGQPIRRRTAPTAHRTRGNNTKRARRDATDEDESAPKGLLQERHAVGRLPAERAASIGAARMRLWAGGLLLVLLLFGGLRVVKGTTRSQRYWVASSSNTAHSRRRIRACNRLRREWHRRNLVIYVGRVHQLNSFLHPAATDASDIAAAACQSHQLYAPPFHLGCPHPPLRLSSCSSAAAPALPCAARSARCPSAGTPRRQGTRCARHPPS